MCNLDYPPVGAYKLPEKNVFVLSCIDLRLTDNLLDFLHFDNLANRYDHFALAGTSLATQSQNSELQAHFKTNLKNGDPLPDFTKWNQTWVDHVKIAIALHEIKDVYIIEHQSCGAYTTFLTKEALKLGEREIHQDFAFALAADIQSNIKQSLHVHTFYIDLRGNVSHMGSF